MLYTARTRLCIHGPYPWARIYTRVGLHDRLHGRVRGVYTRHGRVHASLWEWAILRGKGMPQHARRHSDVSCAKTAEPIEMPFRLCTTMGSGELNDPCFRWGPDPTIESLVCYGNAALCPITLTTCYYY